MKSLRRLIAGAVLALPLAPLLLAPAHAADPSEWFAQRGPSAKCVTGAEFGEIEGKTRAELYRLLDGPGYATPLYREGTRDYRPCGKAWEHGRVTVVFGRNGLAWYASQIKFGGTLELPSDHPRRPSQDAIFGPAKIDGQLVG